MVDTIEKPKTLRTWLEEHRAFLNRASVPVSLIVIALCGYKITRPAPPITDAMIRQTIEAGAAPAEVNKLLDREKVQQAKDAIQKAKGDAESLKEEIEHQKIAEEIEKNEAAGAISAQRMLSTFKSSAFKRSLDELKNDSGKKFEYTPDATGYGNLSSVDVHLTIPSFDNNCSTSSRMVAIFSGDGGIVNGIVLRGASLRDEGPLTALEAVKEITTALHARGVCPFKPASQASEAATAVPSPP